jgi:hypothetical protein
LELGLDDNDHIGCVLAHVPDEQHVSFLVHHSILRLGDCLRTIDSLLVGMQFFGAWRSLGAVADGATAGSWCENS